VKPATTACVVCLAAIALARSGPASHAAESRSAAAAREIPASAAASRTAEIVRIDVAAVESGPEELWLELVPGERRLAYRTGFERSAGGDVVWRGRFADADPGYAGITLSIHGGVMVGSLRTPEGRAWLLDPRTSGDWELRTEESTVLSCDVGRDDASASAHAPEELVERRQADDGPSAATEDAGRDIGILVVYTPDAAAYFNGPELLAARAFHNVDRLNSAWINSGIEGRAVLVGIAELDPGFRRLNFSIALQLAQADAGVRALRDELGADLVSVVVSSEEAQYGCGQANVMTHSLVGPQMAGRAYHVISTHCFSGPTFVHETGHVFGAQHNAQNAAPPAEAAFPFSYAHGVDGKFRTVMAYSTACSDWCWPFEVYSNPLLGIDGEPTGIEGERDNAQTLNLTMPIVAAFRDVAPNPAPFPFGKPKKPTNLVVVNDASSARLTWKDNARNETSYLIEMKAPGSTKFVTVGLEEPDAHSAYLPNALARGRGVYVFRVTAVSGSFRSPPSNEAAITVGRRR
jgi:hypothetical protein